MFDQYSVPLTRYAAAVADSRDLAVELVHDVFLSVWIRRYELDVRTDLATYLFTAVRNAALNVRRKAGLAARIEGAADYDDVPGMGTVPPDGLSATSLDERAALLRSALAQLTPRRREVILLRWTADMSYAQIADVLGLSVRSVESTHARAIEDLRRLLGNRFP